MANSIFNALNYYVVEKQSISANIFKKLRELAEFGIQFGIQNETISFEWIFSEQPKT